MATYKQSCMHCGSLLERDSRFCPQCSSNSPFGHSCPSCIRSVKIEDRICPGCGRELHIQCPYCKESTFVADRCGSCGESLMVKCPNGKCEAMQFFENKKCTTCGKSMSIKKKRGK